MTERLKTSDDRSQKNDGANPRAWWQWLLVYPALAISLLGSIPTVLELYSSNKLGVAFGKSSDAENQNALWQANLDCTKSVPFNSITNQFNVQVGSLVCQSGDVLLSGKRPENDVPQYRWVAWDKIAPVPAKASQLWPIGTASAAPETRLEQATGGAPSGAICQKWLGKGILLRRISTAKGCVDETINTYTGQVVRRVAAPCDPHC